MRIGWILAGVLCAGTALAHPRTTQECSEGRDFIVHATQSRDSGIDGPTFLAHFEDDLQMALGLPPSLRWFVQDQDDVDLLRASANEVFRESHTPEENGASFMLECSASHPRTEARDPSNDPPPTTWL